MSPNEKNLTKRYLIWCYKTTKEDLDRIDRYYTQLKADEIMLDVLRKGSNYKHGNQDYRKLVDGFKSYMDTKKNNVDGKKFEDIQSGKLKSEYLYLKNRFDAIQKTILKLLGKKELNNITRLYEEEMTLRILQAREHS